MKNRYQHLLSHITIPPPHDGTRDLTPKDYQIREVLLGKPTIDIAKVMITTGIREVFKYFDDKESELIIFSKENELLRGYLHGIVGPLDQDHPKVTLSLALERRDKGSVHLDSFLGACQ